MAFGLGADFEMYSSGGIDETQAGGQWRQALEGASPEVKFDRVPGLRVR